MSPRIIGSGTVLLLALSAAQAWPADRRGGPGHCPGCPSAGAPAAVAPAAPTLQRAGDVQYIAGGIGETEQEQMAAREKEFNVKLVFSLVQGNYVADVDLVVSGPKGGKVMEALVRGPIFMAKLPAGEYGIAATYEGRTVKRKITLGKGGLRTEYFRWPAGPDDTPISRWTERQ